MASERSEQLRTLVLSACEDLGTHGLQTTPDAIAAVSALIVNASRLGAEVDAAAEIARLTRELEETRRERSAAKAEALNAQASLRRVERELEEARERERALRDDLTAAIGHLSALVDLLHHDGYPEHSDRAARLVSAAEIYLESPSREQEVGAATPQEASGAD